MNTEPSLQGGIQGRFLWASVNNIFINWSIHNLILCVFPLTNIVDLLTLNSQPEYYKRSLSDTDIFPIRHITDFYCSGILDYTSAVHLQAILTVKSPTKKHQNMKIVALNRPWKRHMLIVWELKQENMVSLLGPQLKCAHQEFQFFRALHICE